MRLRARMVLLSAAMIAALAASGCRAQPNAAGPVRLGLVSVARRAATEPTTAPPVALINTASRAVAVDPLERFDADRALAEAAKVTSFGVREAGSPAEGQAAAYVARRLEDLGYQPEVRTFSLPNGKTSRNVVASVDGCATSSTLILGAHIDSIPPSPGANDNGTGVGVLLEMARLLKKNPPAGRVEFVFFGAEEIVDESNPDGHHFGSRTHARGLTGKQREQTAGMISVDMVGYGSRFYVQNMRRGPQSVADLLLREARRAGIRLGFKKDLGRTGWSDHEAYELLGIPAAWLHWQDDPLYHTPGDTADRLQRGPVEQTGRLVLRTVRELDEADLAELCDR